MREWHDEPFNAQASKVIKELQEENVKLKYENAALKSLGGDIIQLDELSKLDLQFGQLRREIKIHKKYARIISGRCGCVF